MANRGTLLGTLFHLFGPAEEVECIAYESTDTDYLRTNLTPLSIAGEWTIALWMKRNVSGQASDLPIFHIATDNTVGGRINFSQRDNTDCIIEIRNDAGSGSLAQTKEYYNFHTAGSTAPWDHIALVYNSNGGSLDTLLTYYNGVDITNKNESVGLGDVGVFTWTNQNADQTNIARRLTLGARSDGNLEWQGKLYNIGIWDENLSADEIASLFNNGGGNTVDLTKTVGDYSSASNLVHYYRFDNELDRGEDLGTAPLSVLAADAGSHSFTDDDCPVAQGVQTMSLDYDGTFGMSSPTANKASGIDASSGSSYTFSFAIWAKIGTPVDGGRDALMAVRTTVAASALDWGLDDNSNTDLTCILVNASQVGRQFQTWAGVVTPGSWHHIVLTWDGTTGTGSDVGGPHCYVDGVNVDSGNRTAAINSDGSGFNDTATRFVKIGTQIGGTTNWEGPIFNASIYNVALSAAEVSAMYNGGDAQGFDPRVNGGDYVSADELLHFYQLGYGINDADFGHDYTEHATAEPIQLGDTPGGTVDDSDLIEEVPS